MKTRPLYYKQGPSLFDIARTKSRAQPRTSSINERSIVALMMAHYSCLSVSLKMIPRHRKLCISRCTPVINLRLIVQLYLALSFAA